MKSLKEYIKECGCCDCNIATPTNTVGLGNVDPLSTDPVPTANISKKKKPRRRRFKKRV